MGDLLVLCADGVAISPAPLMHGWLSHGVDAVCIVVAQGLYQQLSSGSTNQVIGKRQLVQSQLAGSALNRLGNPVVSYSPVRGSRDLVAARDT